MRAGSSRKSPSPATVSGASAWPPASSARQSADKSTSSPASPNATKPCTSPTRPRTCTLGGAPLRARTLDEVMGIEGACSNACFDALAGCVPADVTFDGRSRRPPRDLPNAALSYGYAILLSECVGALHAAGLEPSLGIAHAPTDKRPSLALDLMEQFRPLLVDQTVMALLRTRKLRPEHGVLEAEAGGVWLGSDGKKILVDAYEAACQRSVNGALPGYSGSWRRHIAHSAQMLARAIAEPDYQWQGIAWR